MKNKTILSLIILTLATLSNAIENATVRITKLNGSTQESHVKLEKIENNIWRFKMPKEKITSDTKYIAILNEKLMFSHCA